MQRIFRSQGVSRLLCERGPLLLRQKLVNERSCSNTSTSKTNDVRDQQLPETVSFETGRRTSENPVWSIKDQASHKTKLSGSYEHSTTIASDQDQTTTNAPPTPATLTPPPPPPPSFGSIAGQVHVAEGRLKSNSPVWSTTTDDYSGSVRSKEGDNISPSANYVPKRNYSTSSSGSTNTDKSKKKVDVHSDMYPPSTVEKQESVPFKTDPTLSTTSTQDQSPLSETTARAVWSVQRSDTVHTPGASSPTTTFVPSSTDTSSHRSTVYSAVGDVNIADPFKTKNVLPNISSTLSSTSSNTATQPVSTPTTPLSVPSTPPSVPSTPAQDQSPVEGTTERTIWSMQTPDAVHIPGASIPTSTFVPSSSDTSSHRSTVYSPAGDISVSNPFKTKNVSPTAPSTSSTLSASSADPSTQSTTSFSPKISSTDVYSSPSSPTSRFDTSQPIDIHQVEQSTHIPSSMSKTFGGHDTSIPSYRSTPTADSTQSTDSTQSREIPIQREDEIRNEILREALKFVDEKGWSVDAIREGIRSRGHPSTVEGLFSNGYDLVDYVVHDANKKMAKYMKEKKEKGDTNTGRLLVDGLKYRLSLIIPYARTWDQALALGAIPQNAVRGWKNILDLSSEAWHGVGDTSTDANWYTKRLLLAAVYKSAEIYMLQDSSPDKIDTTKYLERRLNDFSSLANAKHSASKGVSDASQLFSGLFSVIRNLTFRR